MKGHKITILHMIEQRPRTVRELCAALCMNQHAMQFYLWDLRSMGVIKSIPGQPCRRFAAGRPPSMYALA